MLEENQIKEALRSYEILKNIKIEEEKKELIFNTLLRTYPKTNFSEIGTGKLNVITEVMYVLAFNEKIVLDLKNFK